MTDSAPFALMFEPLTFVSGGIFGTRSGELGCVLSFGEGPDSEAADPATINAITARWESAFRALHEGVRAGVYMLRAGDYIQRHLVLIDPGKSQSKLRAAAVAFAAHLEGVIPMRPLDSLDVLDFFRQLVGDDVSIPRAPRPDVSIGAHLDATVESQADHIRVGDQFVRVVTLKESSSGTIPDLMARVRRMKESITVVVDWLPMNSRDARKLVTDKIAHFHRNKYVVGMASTLLSGLLGAIGGGQKQQQRPEDMQKDEGASENEKQLGKLLAYLEAGGSLGDLSVTFFCSGSTVEEATDTANALIRSFAEADADCWMFLERRNTLNAWFAALPGGHRRQLRGMKATAANAASFAPIFAPEPGACDPLAVLVTREHTQYGLSLHYQDVGHFVITGATGSGKTFTTKYLLSCARDRGAQIFVFDLKTSYEDLVRWLGGSVVRLGYGSEPRMNPFRLDDPKFVKVFVRSLLECGKAAPLDDDDQKAVSDGVDRLYDAKFPAESRRLSMLGLPRNLNRRMEKWLIGGERGSLFDNDSDDLEVSDFQVFSFPALAEGSAIPEELEPLLLYVFHRVSAAVHYGDRSQWKVCLLDEAWRLLQSAAVKNYVIGAVKTWREYNGSLGLATQSSGDFDSAVLQAVVENVGALLFLANPRMDRAEYERIFHLTPRETELIAGLQPKSEILVKRLDHTKVARLVVVAESTTEVVKEKSHVA